MAETLGERIRQARERYGMSQAELSRRVGISKNAMNRIEVSKTPDPAASIVKAVAETLHVSADHLLGVDVAGAGEAATLATVKDRELREMLTRLTARAQAEDAPAPAPPAPRPRRRTPASVG